MALNNAYNLNLRLGCIRSCFLFFTNFYSLSLGTFQKICQFTQEMYSSWFLILSHFQLKNILKHLSMIQECILAKFIVGFRGFVQLGGMV